MIYCIKKIPQRVAFKMRLNAIGTEPKETTKFLALK